MNKSTLPQCVQRQHGVALIVALLVVALATVLIAGLLDRGELTAARTRNQLRAAQAQAYAQGLEAYAARVLQQDGANGNQSDTASDVWAMPLPPTPVPGGEIAATMRDLDGRFNLNNLDPAYDTNGAWQKKFELLLIALKLDPNLAQVVHDWMSTAAANQTGDQYYLAQPVPYRSAKRQFQHVSELRLLKGVSGDVYAQLAPYVSALPAAIPINVNTASVPVLMTLTTANGPLTQQSAQALWQQGHASFQSLSELPKIVPGLVVDTQSYAIKSSYFLARGEITLDGLPFVFYSLIQRDKSGPSGGIRVIQRSRGADG
jgi:general secretion pathway protein K